MAPRGPSRWLLRRPGGHLRQDYGKILGLWVVLVTLLIISASFINKSVNFLSNLSLALSPVLQGHRRSRRHPCSDVRISGHAWDHYPL